MRRLAWGCALLLGCSSSGSGSGTPSPDAGPPGPASTLGGCEIFSADDPWKVDVSGMAADPTWTAKLLAHATKTMLHPDFGDGYGLPVNVVPRAEPGVAITFGYDDESDPGPYPFPASVRVEGGTATDCSGDCHVLVVQEETCVLWEAWACAYDASPPSWDCGSGAKFDLTRSSFGQRPGGWTSADAAGLAITPGLVREAEAASGSVEHAIRFTMHCTQDGFVAPASHEAVPDECPPISEAMLRAEYPPMGTRIRLERDYPTGAMPARARAIAEAMKKYGMILADNGSDWFFQGEDSPAWDNEELDALKDIPASQFEVLKMPAIER